MRFRRLGIGLFLLVFWISACGVKGPPLPPIPATPQRSESTVRSRPSPKPSINPKSASDHL